MAHFIFENNQEVVHLNVDGFRIQTVTFYCATAINSPDNHMRGTRWIGENAFKNNFYNRYGYSCADMRPVKDNKVVLTIDDSNIGHGL